MMQQKSPDDYVIATGKNYSVRYFIEKCFKKIGIEIYWQGKGINEKGLNKKNNKILVKVDSRYFRPAEVNNLKGDYSKAKKILNWKPIIMIDDLIHEMIENDINELG